MGVVARWWRGERTQRFVREVGSVVLGVLIALGIGEIADDVRWRFKVRDSEAAMRAELATVRFALVERMAGAACVDRELDAIRRVLLDARRGAPVPTLVPLAAPPYRLIESTAFEIARDEGVSLHMPPGRWRMYAAAYAMASGMFGAANAPEREQWDRLRLLETLAGPLDPGLAGELLVAWEQARAYARRQQGLARQSDRTLARLGVPIDWRFNAGPDGPTDLAGLRARVAAAPLCRRPVPGSARDAAPSPRAR